MDYSELCEYYQKLDGTTKRLEKTAIMTELLRNTSASELKQVVYLLHGTVFPDWDERKLGVSSQIIVKALTIATGTDKDKVIGLWKKHGDLGLVAEELIKNKKQRTLHSEKLSVAKVFTNIEKLATLEGKGTVASKISLLSELLGNATSLEARYVVRTVLGTLRVGVAAGILRDSIASAFNKEVSYVEEAFNLLVDYGEIAKLAKENKLGKVELKLGRPIQIMLAVPVASIEEAFEAVGKPCQLEYKMDGFRITIHKNKDLVRLFTRRLEDVTKQFPDVVEYANKNVKANSFIIDCEAVGVDKRTGKYLPFQKISQRIKRKYGIDEMVRDFPVELNVFDIIYYEGNNISEKSQGDRRKILEKIINQEKGRVILTKKLVTDDSKKAEDFFNQALKDGVEGLMAKNIHAAYKPGRYVRGWVKLKKILEPLDVVITKAEFGEGKRASFLSSYTIACRKGNKLVEIGKVSTGMKEKSAGLTFDQMTKMLKPLIIKQRGREAVVKPEIIIEVGYEEIQESQNYSSGFALRFPRVKRLRIDEKTVKDINTLDDLRRIYFSQRGRKKFSKKI